MRSVALSALFAACLAVAANAQPPAVPAPAKAEDPKAAAAKGFLPQNWKSLGLTDDQKSKVYTIQNRYNEQIDKLEAQIKELKGKMSAERMEVLTAEQKKRLSDLLKSKAGVNLQQPPLVPRSAW